ncbi:MAG: EAL domain-containing protein [Chromatiales bacterium]|nr:EAL domain-containing protein [Chromatiales bacterium]MCK7582197.1 EAL domain-containing protein [Chromatiales bacterium]
MTPLTAALANQRLGAAILDAGGRLRWSNAALRQITGFDMTASLGHPPPFLAAEADLHWPPRNVGDRAASWQGELDGRDARGGSLVLQASLSLLPPVDAGAPDWLLLCFDISQQLAYTDHLEQLLRIDPLTRLLNRETFRELTRNALYRCRASGQRVVVLFLDLDGFKTINDTHGHAAGDQLLRQIAKRLKRLAREQDAPTEIARLGGDEFAVLIAPAPDPIPAAEAFGQAVLAALAEPFPLTDAPPQRLAVSIGGALGPLKDESVSALLHRADQAMYRVKESGGHAIGIMAATPDAEPKTPRLDFAQAVREQQFQSHFQPIVELTGGILVAIEARVRWSDGSSRQFTAREVLRAAGAARAEAMLDFIVLEQAIAAIEHLSELNAPPPVAVNLSAATCLMPDFITQLDALLNPGAVDPAQLHLEIPLDAFKRAPTTMPTLIEQLHGRRIAVTVDHVDSADFRALHLDQAPVRAIKFDERLVESATGDARAVARLRAIHLAAVRRGWRVGAEGIERLEQLECLRDIGCHEGQGPLIARPRPVEELRPLVRRGRCW